MKNKKFKIIFVCSENISRSLIAEYCLKKYLKDNNIDNIEVSSAGTDKTDSDISNRCFSHFDELKKMGIDVSGHTRKPLTQEMVEEADLIVSMAQVHQDWIKENLEIYAPLFNEILIGRKESINLPSPDDEKCDQTLRNLVHYIYNAMPPFVKNMKKWKQETK